MIRADSPDYESLRRPPIARYHEIRPAAIALCETPDEVAHAIAFAREEGHELVPRAGGHCFAGSSSTRGVVLDVSPMGSVRVSDGRATIGGGARLGDVYDELDARGVTIPGGCGPTVGIAGLTLGGGLGILGRKHGLTADSLRAAEVVLANGRVVECDETEHADLFWALRGAGGGHVGVVTSLSFDTLPAPPSTAFHLTWPQDQIPLVLEAWQDWAPAAPGELAASLLVKAPGEREQPVLAHVFGAFAGGEGEAAELLDDLVARVGTDPSTASSAGLTYRETKRYLVEAGDRIHGGSEGEPPEEGGFMAAKSEFFRQPLASEGIHALLEHVTGERVPGQSRDLDFMPWGGAYNRTATGATAFPHREELFLLKHGAELPAGSSPTENAAADDWVARSWELAHPWGTGGAYVNFRDSTLDDLSPAYHAENLERLLEVKRAYDPDGVFG